ncbi:MAG: hypothetical protein U0359_01125 [Byssovorax sp.]
MTARIDLPVEALTVVAAPPALITRHNVGHVGLTVRQLLDVLRAMRLEPRFAPEVVVYGKSVRGAPPAAILAFLRTSQASTSSSSAPSAPANDAAPDDDVEDLAQSLGLQRVARPEAKRAGRGRG